MLRLLLSLLVLIFFNPALSSTKNEVISKMLLTNNFSFNFDQTINKKKENGSCIIRYPKKIYCKYDNYNEKIIVSDGKSLVIKVEKTGSYYFYPLKKTPLELLLNKSYLISKMISLEPREIDNKYLNFEIIENDNKINIFFDKNTFDLVGWQTEDIYQNLTITFISSVKINQEIDDSIFILPKKN